MLFVFTALIFLGNVIGEDKEDVILGEVELPGVKGAGYIVPRMAEQSSPKEQLPAWTAKKITPAKAEQSTTDGRNYAAYFIDISSKTCGQTRKESKPYQRVILRQSYYIQDVQLWGTAGSSKSKTVEVTVFLYNSGRYVGVCGKFNIAAYPYQKIISCNGMKASVVQIQILTGKGSAYLKMCNLVVRGNLSPKPKPTRNPTRRPTPRPNPSGKIYPRGAEQVGTKDGKGANLIIDGKTSTCSRTTKESKAWQRIYLDGMHTIDFVTITGTAKSSSFFGRTKITLEVNTYKGNQKFALCGIYTVSSGVHYSQTLNCHGFAADNLILEITDGTASLLTCEWVTTGKKKPGPRPTIRPTGTIYPTGTIQPTYRPTPTADIFPVDAEQSSTDSINIAWKIVDGDSSSRGMTKSEDVVWQRVYFSYVFIFDSVKINGFGKSGAVVEVSVWREGRKVGICGTFQKYSSYDVTLQCHGHEGNSIYIESKYSRGTTYMATYWLKARGHRRHGPGPRPLPIATLLPVYADQSSNDGLDVAAEMIDGKDSSGAETKMEVKPWQRVYYSGIFALTNVTIHSASLRSTLVKISAWKGDQKVGICGGWMTYGVYTKTASCHGYLADNIKIEAVDAYDGSDRTYLKTYWVKTTGRRLRRDPYPNTPITIATVSADQSSDYGSNIAVRMIDNSQTTKATTNSEDIPWQRVFLSGVFAIEEVKIHGYASHGIVMVISAWNGDRMVGYCATIRPYSSFTNTVKCHGHIANTIRIDGVHYYPGYGTIRLQTYDVDVKGHRIY